MTTLLIWAALVCLVICAGATVLHILGKEDTGRHAWGFDPAADDAYADAIADGSRDGEWLGCPDPPGDLAPFPGDQATPVHDACWWSGMDSCCVCGSSDDDPVCVTSDETAQIDAQLSDAEPDLAPLPGPCPRCTTGRGRCDCQGFCRHPACLGGFPAGPVAVTADLPPNARQGLWGDFGCCALPFAPETHAAAEPAPPRILVGPLSPASPVYKALDGLSPAEYVRQIFARAGA